MIEVGELSDRVLWQQAREGRGPAFGVLFERHAGRIYNYCFRRTGDCALAEGPDVDHVPSGLA
jgi:RNA polymerase sigma-70 factor (ECF subfamily)